MQSASAKEYALFLFASANNTALPKNLAFRAVAHSSLAFLSAIAEKALCC